MTDPKQHILELIEIGDTVGVVLPAEFIAQHKLVAGDELHCRSSNGIVTLTKGDSEFERQMAAAREVMAKDRETLAKLAKL